MSHGGANAQPGTGVGLFCWMSTAPTPATSIEHTIVAMIVAPPPPNGCVRITNSVSAAASRPTYDYEMHM